MAGTAEPVIFIYLFIFLLLLPSETLAQVLAALLMQQYQVALVASQVV